MIAKKHLPAWGSEFDNVYISLSALPPPYVPPPARVEEKMEPVSTREIHHSHEPDITTPVEIPSPQPRKRPLKESSLYIQQRPPKKAKSDPVIRAEADSIIFKKTVAANMLLMTKWCTGGMVSMKLATETRPRSTAMDVIAIWLGMKLMKDAILSCTNITAARKVVRGHPCFKVGYDFWKKNMGTGDEYLRQVFQIENITSDEEIEEFALQFTEGVLQAKTVLHEELPRPEKEEVSIRDDEVLCM
jgi:hypothetical protein